MFSVYSPSTLFHFTLSHAPGMAVGWVGVGVIITVKITENCSLKLLFHIPSKSTIYLPSMAAASVTVFADQHFRLGDGFFTPTSKTVPGSLLFFDGRQGQAPLGFFRTCPDYYVPLSSCSAQPNSPY